MVDVFLFKIIFYTLVVVVCHLSYYSIYNSVMLYLLYMKLFYILNIALYVELHKHIYIAINLKDTL